MSHSILFDAEGEIEQELIISRALVDLFNQAELQCSLVFRGGTVLNKMYINPPARYSEDIDLVQINAEPIGKPLDAIREVLDIWLGELQRKLTERSAKLVYRYMAVDNTPAKLKIEINTTEHFLINTSNSRFFCNACAKTYTAYEWMTCCTITYCPRRRHEFQRGSNL